MTAKIVSGMIPTLTLRGVDPLKVQKEYLDGKYSEYQPATRIGQWQPSAPVIKHEIASTVNEPISGFQKSGTTQLIATTHCQPFLQFLHRGTQQVMMGGRCQYCNRTFTHEAMGIPLKVEPLPENKLLIYYVDKTCSYPCAFALWKRKYNGGTRYRDFRYADGEQILRYLYAIQHPESGPLEEPPSPELLKCNGGSLDDNEYDQNKHYVESPSFVFQPVKLQSFKRE